MPDSQREIKRIAMLTTSVLYKAGPSGSHSHSHRHLYLDHPDRVKACWSLVRGICNMSACDLTITAMVPGLEARLSLPGQSRWDLLADSLPNPPLTPGRGVHPKDPSVANHVAV